MCARGKYELFTNESEAKPANKRILALKLFYFIVIIGIFFFVLFVYFQDFFKARNVDWKNYKSYNSDHPSSTQAAILTTQQTSTRSKACGVEVNNGPMIKVGSLHTYVTGSYMDYRFPVREIKTIAIVRRQQQVEYICVMCCDGKNVTSPAQYIIHSDHFGFEYGTATIRCQINSMCLTPTHVALTSSELSGDITSFQPIGNTEPKHFSYNFTICISVMFNYKNVLNLVEAIEMFRLLGAERVAIYRTDCDSDVQKVLDYYVKQKIVEVIPWTISKHIEVSNGWRSDVSAGQLHYHGQIPALNDCVYRYMYTSRYVALQDMDEIILPLRVKTWTQMLPELEKIYGDKSGFEFENNLFPFTSKAQTENDVKEWKHLRGTNILNYIKRVPNDPHAFNNYKIIVNPRLVLKATVHGLLDTVNNMPTIRVKSDIARMYHSKNMTYSPNTNLITDNRLLDYAKDLKARVSKVLRDCGLI